MTTLVEKSLSYKDARVFEHAYDGSTPHASCSAGPNQRVRQRFTTFTLSPLGLPRQ